MEELKAESKKQKAIEAIDVSKGYDIISANINRFNSFLLFAFCFKLLQQLHLSLQHLFVQRFVFWNDIIDMKALCLLPCALAYLRQ